jgi:hypothetical protein
MKDEILDLVWRIEKIVARGGEDSKKMITERKGRKGVG